MKKLEVFQKLIDTIKTNCPGVITEDIQAQFNTEFDDTLHEIEDNAYQSGFEKGQADGFKDGYAQAKRIADENLQAEVEKVKEQCDDQAVAKITEILQVVDEENTEKLEVVYNMVKEYQAELEAMDEDHANKLGEVQDYYETKLNEKDQADAAMLQQYAEAVDKDHTKKLKYIFEQISQDHANKLNECVDFINSKHEKQLQAEHDKKIDLLSESVEKYLNYALEKNLPKKNLVSEQKYNVAMKTLDKMKDYLKVNGIIQESKSSIFTDYEKQINSAKEKTEKLISENAKLNKKIQRQEAQMVLQEKIKDCTPAQAKFLRAHFAKAASPKVIQESIEDVRKSFKKEQAAKRAKAQAEYRKSGSASPSSIVLQNKEKEFKKVQTTANKTPDNIAEYYANYLKQKVK